MERITHHPPLSTICVDSKSESVETGWIDVADRLPGDGEQVHVKMKSSREVRTAWRGHYESTGAWFDANTRCPVYEAITHWKPRK